MTNIGLIGTKIGMSREFFPIGISVPVTVIKIEKGRVIDLITKDKSGYDAIKVGFGKIKTSKLTKSMKGFYSKKSTEPKKYLKEYRVENISIFKEGNEIGLEIFKDVKFVDVTSKSIGKGFAGVMKRYNFSGLGASHGVSISHRSGGSTGQRQDPGKVFKGRKMAGHMGDKIRTTLNLEIIKSDLNNDLIYLKGSIPGSKNTLVFLKNSVKKINKKTILEKNKIVEKQDKNPKKMSITKEKITTKVEQKKEDMKKKVEKKDIKSE
jgi:large subunit ribosomal protein L3